MSCTGSSFMETPNLDGLAHDGALFRNLILATSVCAPSRASFMTGTYNWVNGVFANAAKWDPENVILAQMMQNAGYATAHIGKPRSTTFWRTIRGRNTTLPPIPNIGRVSTR